MGQSCSTEMRVTKHRRVEESESRKIINAYIESLKQYQREIDEEVQKELEINSPRDYEIFVPHSLANYTYTNDYATEQ